MSQDKSGDGREREELLTDDELLLTDDRKDGLKREEREAEELLKETEESEARNRVDAPAPKVHIKGALADEVRETEGLLKPSLKESDKGRKDKGAKRGKGRDELKEEEREDGALIKEVERSERRNHVTSNAHKVHVRDAIADETREEEEVVDPTFKVKPSETVNRLYEAGNRQEGVKEAKESSEEGEDREGDAKRTRFKSIVVLVVLALLVIVGVCQCSAEKAKSNRASLNIGSSILNTLDDSAKAEEESAALAAAKAEAPVFKIDGEATAFPISASTELDNIKLSFVAYDDHAIVNYPEGVTNVSINGFIDALNVLDKNSATLFSFETKGEGEMVISYPRVKETEEVISYANELLTDLDAYIIEISENTY